MGVNKLTSNASTSKISGNVTSAVPASVTLSGGTIATPGNGYRYHTFTSTSALENVLTLGPDQKTFPAENVYNRSRTVGTTYVASADADPAQATKTLEILSVAGGGGGTGNGGAGAGGLVYHPGLPVTFTSITVTVGGGGVRADPTVPTPATNGGNSVLTHPDFTMTSLGGGGAYNQEYGTGSETGAGGSSGTSPGTPTGWGLNSPYDNKKQPGQAQPGVPSPYEQYGNNAGNTLNTSSGGGGGAGAVGEARTPEPTNEGWQRNKCQDGGDGRQYPQFAAPLIGVPALAPLSSYWAGGGGGGCGNDGYINVSDGTPGAGGAGGGGRSGRHNGGKSGCAPAADPQPGNGGDGVANSGGGGGGKCNPSTDQVEGQGGSGIVCIRYSLS